MLFLNEIFLEKKFSEKNNFFQSSVHIVKSITTETHKKIKKIIQEKYFFRFKMFKDRKSVV